MEKNLNSSFAESFPGTFESLDLQPLYKKKRYYLFLYPL